MLIPMYLTFCRKQVFVGGSPGGLNYNWYNKMYRQGPPAPRKRAAHQRFHRFAPQRPDFEEQRLQQTQFLPGKSISANIYIQM
jgi:hypothetical protein